jgi:hypothetical protein
MIHIIFCLIIFCIFLIIIFSCVKIYQKIKTKEKENFVVDYTTTVADNNQRTNYGLERCKFLDVNPNEVSPKEYIMVQELVQTNRIKEWKPNNIPYTSSNNTCNVFCYLYDDPNNGMQDMMMMNCNCDIEKNIFKNNPMVKRVFKNTELDKSHTVPIQKCVIEFDKSERNVDNISKFFGAISDEYCTSLAGGLFINLSDLQKQYVELYDKNTKQEYNNRVIKSKYDYAYKSNVECIDNNKVVNERIKIYSNSNANVLSKTRIVKEEYELCEKNLKTLWYNTSNTINELNKDISLINYNTQTEISNVVKCENSNLDLKNFTDRRFNLSKEMLKNNSNTYSQNSNLYIQNSNCSSELRITTDSAAAYLNEYNRCYPNIEKFNECDRLLKVCKKEVAICIVQKNSNIQSYEENNMNNEICSSNVRDVQIDLDNCAFSNNIVQTINRERIARVKKQDITIQDLIKKNEECSAYLQSRIAFKQELDRRNEELRKQREQLIIECAIVRKEKESATMELAKTQMERNAVSALKKIPQKCDYQNMDDITIDDVNNIANNITEINLNVKEIK